MIRNKHRFNRLNRGLVLAGVLLAVAGCARVAVEGGDKPIHIVMDINVRIIRELDQFFAFEEKIATPPATQPVGTASGLNGAAMKATTEAASGDKQ